MKDKHGLLRQIARVDDLLKTPEVVELVEAYPRSLVVEAVRKALDGIRDEIVSGSREEIPKNVQIAELAEIWLKKMDKPGLRRVINATGVILHTNLGRAVLSQSAIKAVTMAASGYSNVELDLPAGKRGRRTSGIEDLIRYTAGSEASMVVNNNAAAVLLALSSLARGREVIVSRGQLVEIGGSFRIPEIMEQSGAVLKEVGSTNKTYPDDYSRAINERTALLLHVHPSNFRIVGFTREISVEELVQIGRLHGLPVMCDLGSGFLLEMESFGLPPEPTVQEVLKSGADLVTFSGDKLLGGPQAGIITGKAALIEKLKRNPLTRALRIDKMTAAALEETLREYLDHDRAIREVPTLRMLAMDPEQLLKKSDLLAQKIISAVGGSVEVFLEKDVSAVGGGAMPTAELPGWLVSFKVKEVSAEEMASRLRSGIPAVMARVQEDKLLLDVRTVLPGEEGMLADAVARAVTGAPGHE